jgi:uncharacterized protein (TIGR02118 family)
MIKKVFAMSYPEDIPFQESENRYLEVHTQLAKKIPGIIKYVTYKSIHIPHVEQFPEPDFYRLTEIWWEDMDSLKATAGSPQVIEVLKDNLRPDKTPRFRDMRDVTLTDEVNLLQPDASYRDTMNELSGQPTVKVVFAQNYPPGVSREEGDEWYFGHHATLAARIPGLLRLVTYTTTMAPGDKEPSFYRYTEMWYRDLEALLTGNASPEGQAALEDIVAPDGSSRIIMDTPFFGGPAVVGFEINIV